MAASIKRYALAAMALGFVAFGPEVASAAPGDNCSGDYYIDQAFPSGARWQLCWEHRNLEGILLSDIFYTPPGGTARKVLQRASLAQIHVPYDDNGARFHDVTDYGIGGSNMDDLEPSECPGCTLLEDNNKDVVCHQVVDRDAAYRHHGRFARAQVMKLFSVSHVGAYNYIPEWRFHEDGRLQPTVGATGRLQRFGTNPTYGWPISSGSTTGVAHIHNYHWRLDFEFDETDRSEVVEEIDHVRVGSTREVQVTALTTESNRSVDLDLRRSWRVRHGSATNAAGAAISYHIEPSHHAHRHTGPSYEPWTNDDLYVTRYSSCENYATHNDNVGGCGDNLTDFVNAQDTFEEDLVVWYSMTFHHLPTDEDEPNMHTHWDGFDIVPRDWTASNPLPEAPEITPPAPQILAVGTPMTLDLITQNPAGATLSFEADALPPGLSIDPGTGQISGTPAPGTIGDYSPKVRVLGEMAGKTGWLGDAIVIAMQVTSGIACSDGIDNDGDGLIDFGAGGDPGCVSATSNVEDPECQDGIDNDGAAGTDFDGGASAGAPLDPDGADPHCSSFTDGKEAAPSFCGLGAELVLVLPVLAWGRARSRSARIVNR